jgi:hypothetical protein
MVHAPLSTAWRTGRLAAMPIGPANGFRSLAETSDDVGRARQVAAVARPFRPPTIAAAGEVSTDEAAAERVTG